jgi:hypothetical protein
MSQSLVDQYRIKIQQIIAMHYYLMLADIEESLSNASVSEEIIYSFISEMCDIIAMQKNLLDRLIANKF